MKPPLKKNLTHDSFNHKSLRIPFEKEAFPNKEIIKPNNRENEIEYLLEEKIKIIEKIEKDSMHILKGHFFRLITSQNGSRILQKALQNSHSSVLLQIFEEVKDRISELMIDPYANYFCPVFYSHLEKKEKLIFLNKVIFFKTDKR